MIGVEGGYRITKSLQAATGYAMFYGRNMVKYKPV